MTEAERGALRARLVTHLSGRWRTRFAPAPTGHLHLGHAVNAVWIWSIARAFDGQVVLRIEDHDQQRSRDAYLDSILTDLAWLGLEPDNAAVGLTMPNKQSDRPGAYTDALTFIAQRERVYACRCSRRDIAAQVAVTHELRYPGTCRRAGVSVAETEARRLWLPAEEAVDFADLRHGAQSQVPAEQCGDLLLRDRLAQWTYQFAVVVDDIAEAIDVVIRGDDLLPSTGRQMLLARMLGRDRPPLFLHHPLVTHPDGTKLSKSSGDTSLGELRSAGWSPEQILGHAAWLGGLQSASTALHVAELTSLWRSPG